MDHYPEYGVEFGPDFASEIRKWVNKRICSMEQDQGYRAGVLAAGNLNDRGLDRLVSMGCKLRAYREVLNYIDSHAIQDAEATNG